MVNVTPDEDDLDNKLERLVHSPREEIERMNRESLLFVKKHHDHRRVAEQYIKFWETEG